VMARLRCNFGDKFPTLDLSGLSWLDVHDAVDNVPEFGCVLKDVVDYVENNRFKGELLSDIKCALSYPYDSKIILIENPLLQRTRNLKSFPNVFEMTFEGTIEQRFFDQGLSKVDLVILDHSWILNDDPCSSLLGIRRLLDENTKILVYGPRDVYDLFLVHHELGTYDHYYAPFCLDAVVYRMSQLRCHPIWRGFVHYYQFRKEKSISVNVDDADIFPKRIVCVQGIKFFDAYVRGYDMKALKELIELNPGSLLVSLYGGIIGTPWFLVRFNYFDWAPNFKFSIFDSRLWKSPPEYLYKEIFKRNWCNPDRSIFTRNGMLLQSDPDLNEDIEEFGSIWIYYPPVDGFSSAVDEIC